MVLNKKSVFIQICYLYCIAAEWKIAHFQETKSLFTRKQHLQTLKYVLEKKKKLYLPTIFFIDLPFRRYWNNIFLIKK